MTFEEAVELYEEAEDFAKQGHVGVGSKLMEVATERAPSMDPKAAVRIACFEIFRTVARAYWGGACRDV